jgi:hypothetical protein
MIVVGFQGDESGEDHCHPALLIPRSPSHPPHHSLSIPLCPSYTQPHRAPHASQLFQSTPALPVCDPPPPHTHTHRRENAQLATLHILHTRLTPAAHCHPHNHAHRRLTGNPRELALGGVVQPGDALVTINGVRPRLKTIVEIFRSSKRPTKLEFVRNADSLSGMLTASILPQPNTKVR